MIKNHQKGVSLIITFFILTIILAVVLGISTILYSEIRIIRNIGNSVVSFYAAESGVEKTLYYDRKIVPDEGKRGLCFMCDPENPSCPTDNADSSVNCMSCQLSGPYCNSHDSNDCTDCQIEFRTDLNGKSYSVKATVLLAGENTNFTIDAIGSYENVKRAIRLMATKNEP